MTDYTRERARDFWYDFDDQTLVRRTRTFTRLITNAFGPLGGLDGLVDLFRASYRGSNHPQAFTGAINRVGDAFVLLANEQWRVMASHFDDEDDLTLAFIDFGQGVLFDDRAPRDPNNAIHSMDDTPDRWVGFHRWHAAIRAAMLTGADETRWLAMLRRVALAWAIQTETAPAHDRDDNPGLSDDRIAALRRYWLNASLEELDRDFVAYTTRAPRRSIAEDGRGAEFAALPAEQIATSYAVVTEILERAAKVSHPDHGSRGRFWTLPLNEFLAIGTIRHVEVIAQEGEDRGERSGLIQALRGIGEFTEDGFGRMPRDLPPVPDEEIAYISRWIDEGCPP
jgi:hypothetical protein